MYICTGKNEKSKAIYLAAISQEKKQIGICVSNKFNFHYVLLISLLYQMVYITLQNLIASMTS